MCPDGEDKFLGRAGFAFHEPHPQHPDPSRTVSKYLQFQVLRRDERECLWNYSKTCLAGGSFAMKFGKTARDILHPGDYKLKTSDGGVIRIVAYNTNRDCAIASTPEVRPQSSSPQVAAERSPINFCRRRGRSRRTPGDAGSGSRSVGRGTTSLRSTRTSSRSMCPCCR